MVQVKRVGNWYKVSINEKEFDVLIQKNEMSNVCDPSSIIVLDENFSMVHDPNVIEKIERVMGSMDWKYDVINED
jgi:hypothetical protein